MTLRVNTDVTVQWLPIAESIYQEGYYFVFTNNIIENRVCFKLYSNFNI